MTMIETIEQWLAETLGLGLQTVANLLTVLVIIIVTLIVRTAVKRIIERSVEDVTNRHRWRRTLSSVIFLIGLTFAAAVLLQEATSFATLLGLLGAGLAVVLRDPIVNLLGWAFIVSARPFDIGDRIQIGPHKGDVIDVKFFQFVLLEVGEWVGADQSTGRLLYVPNQKLFTDPLANYHSGFSYVWHEMSFTLTFDSNWEKAMEIVRDVADRHEEKVIQGARAGIEQAQDRYPITYEHVEPGVFMEIIEHGIQLTLRLLTKPRGRRMVEHLIWTDIMRAFRELEDISLAYPTVRVWQGEHINLTGQTPQAQTEPQ